MYTILVTHNNELIATEKQAIMQRSKLVDELRFLVPPDYSGKDMSEFKAVMLEYTSPVSHTYRTEYLTLQEERYKEHLQYILPVDTKITAEAGDVEIQLSFFKVELDPDTGKPFERVRKTQPLKIPILFVANWSQFIADEALTPIDQRIVQLEAIANQMHETHEQLENSKADNFYVQEDKMYLLSNGKVINSENPVNIGSHTWDDFDDTLSSDKTE